MKTKNEEKQGIILELKIALRAFPNLSLGHKYITNAISYLEKIDTANTKEKERGDYH